MRPGTGRPFAALTPEPASPDVRSSSTSSNVEPTGLEPVTPCLQSRCATNCAMAPGVQLSVRPAGPTSTNASRRCAPGPSLLRQRVGDLFPLLADVAVLGELAPDHDPCGRQCGEGQDLLHQDAPSASGRRGPSWTRTSDLFLIREAL